jgi:hypothetical protein
MKRLAELESALADMKRLAELESALPAGDARR